MHPFVFILIPVLIGCSRPQGALFLFRLLFCTLPVKVYDHGFWLPSIFKPVAGFFITPILIDLNILVFVVMVCTGVNFMLPDNGSMIRWGANFSPLTLDGEWWRLLTCCFLHIGVLHLLMNMYALLYIGLLLEPYLGRLRFLTAYLLTGILASLSSLGWHDLTVSAGTSGAIFGMYGVFLAMLTINLIERAARQAFLTSIPNYVARYDQQIKSTTLFSQRFCSSKMNGL